MIVVSTCKYVAARNLEWVSSCQLLWFTCINKYLQHFPMMLYEQVLSYERTMKCSIIVRSLIEICSSLDNLIKVLSPLETLPMSSMQLACHTPETAIRHHSQLMRAKR